MKKFINTLAIVWILVPVFASASAHNISCTDITVLGSGATCVGNTITFSGASSYAQTSSGVGLTVPDGATIYMSGDVAGVGGTPSFKVEASPNDGSLTGYGLGTNTDIVYIAPSGNTANHFLFYDNGVFVGTLTNICWSDNPGECGASPPPPPAPATGIDAAVGVATSSFRDTFGFDMDGVSEWMWDNLGQPILGSGIGVLFVMRFYWLGFLAISLIVFFGFMYFRFFRQ